MDPGARAPEWLKYVDFFHWLGRLDIPWPSIDLPGWADRKREVLAADRDRPRKNVASGEVDRRRKKSAGAAEQD